MTPQSNFMVVAPIVPERVAALNRLLSSMNNRPGMANPRNSIIPFGEFKRLHYARFVGLDDQTLHDFKRIGEALRSLEEYAKLVDVWLAGRFEVLRYDIYTLEKLTMTAVAAHRVLGDARLMDILVADVIVVSLVLSLLAFLMVGRGPRRTMLIASLMLSQLAMAYGFNHCAAGLRHWCV